MGKGTLLATRGAFGLGDLGAGVLEQRNEAAQMPPGPGQLPALKHKLLGNLPRELASSKVAVARGLLVDGLLQIQVPARPAEGRVISVEWKQSLSLNFRRRSSSLAQSL